MQFRVRRVAETGSTNADVLAAAAAGEPEGLVIVAGTQTAGRGRLGRSWQSPPDGGLWCTTLLRPVDVPTARIGWLPLLAGVALAEAVRAVTGLDAGLKWPNDLLVRDAKCAGVLAESDGAGAIALGVGLNTNLEPGELPPTPTGIRATSLAYEQRKAVDNEEILDGFLTRLGERYDSWQAASGDAAANGLHSAYAGMCVTIGREVRVILPGGAERRGLVTTVDGDGRLVVAGTPVAAGDVVHVRPMARLDGTV
ncbi:biotin--[acetyl-CoA-carboxylase] ligase [Hamadaea tsunoensis]|uniref:biotin--[acetyl-CoA-carboxylase] ligase n=1 Tax=Hamadaea tsunoensis TaxID=53368 RepID=UPI000421073B|nr:biotin--[acetyl-CoA-carboxylase] ligase [Hamadaea tsunoensis]